MNVQGKHVLITGGAGFIGSHLVEEYLANEAGKVVVYDDFSTGTMENLNEIRDKRLEIVKGSVLDVATLNDALKKEKINIIDHLAAELEVYTGIKDTEKDAHINILGTLNILNIALKNKVEKVLFASSGAVYGEAKYLPIDEEHPLEPHWPYGVSKLSAERYVIQYHKLFGLNTTAFRYGIVYGPREWFGRVLTMFIKRVFLENKPPVVFGEGMQTRDFVYVKDIVRAHMLAIKKPEATGKVFNLGSGKGISIKELATMLLKMANKELDIIYDNPQEGSASRFQPERIRLQGELKNFVLDCRKAQKVLGWSPQTDFTDGLAKEIEWILKFPRRWSGKPRV
ncbi:MAG: GDP-mannose 4,6-dehydratase [Candidatus Bathyarchaeota archaeon]|nr:GDP-mannose 4,6-dehydratase [Candidatus Bathyarchaeota archaeon]MDI6805942.1 GDP-mannose 4,6-dehydratase [Candidatus Bathyarchaeia archaeon]